MPLNHFLRLLCTFYEIIQITGKIQTNDQSICSSSWPHHSDLMIRDADRALFTHSPALHQFTSFNIPYFNGLVYARGDKAFGILCPRHAEDASFMFIFPYLRFGFPCLSIIKPYLPVSPHARQRCSIWTKGYPINITIVFPQTRIKLKRGSVIEH